MARVESPDPDGIMRPGLIAILEPAMVDCELELAEAGFLVAVVSVAVITPVEDEDAVMPLVGGEQLVGWRRRRDTSLEGPDPYARDGDSYQR